MANRQPAVLLLLGHGDGLTADCRGHDGADGVGEVRGLLEKGGIFQLDIGLRKTECGVALLGFSTRFEPLLHPLFEFLIHYSVTNHVPVNILEHVATPVIVHVIEKGEHVSVVEPPPYILANGPLPLHGVVKDPQSENVASPSAHAALFDHETISM